MKPKLKFTIGDHVHFTHVLVFSVVPNTGGRERKTLRLKQTRGGEGRGEHAVITGCKLLFTGELASGGYEPTMLVNRTGAWVYTARQGMSNAELYLPVDGEFAPTRCNVFDPASFPFRHGNFETWDYGTRQIMREEAQKAPRDAKGRFVSAIEWRS